MSIVYLINGQACYLKEQIGERFIVNKIFEYPVYDYEGGDRIEEFEDPTDTIVNKVFDTPPIAKISSEIKELLNQRTGIEKENERLVAENRKVKYENEQIIKTQINQEKFIINRTDLINAKTLVFFPSDKVMPIKMDANNKSFYGLKLSMETKISSGETNSWGCQLYYDNNYSSGQYLDKKYGILINPTEEEIEAMIIKRLKEQTFSDYALSAADNKYLSDEQITIKNNYLAKNRENQIQQIERNIKSYQEQIEKLKEQK